MVTFVCEHNPNGKGVLVTQSNFSYSDAESVDPQIISFLALAAGVKAVWSGWRN
jgi:hypothetical protein